MTSERVDGLSIRQHSHKPNGIAVEDMESCPWCGSPISRAEFHRIRDQIAEQERARAAKVEQTLKQQFARETAAIRKQATATAAAALAPKIAEAVSAAVNAEKQRAYGEHLKL